MGLFKGWFHRTDTNLACTCLCLYCTVPPLSIAAAEEMCLIDEQGLELTREERLERPMCNTIKPQQFALGNFLKTLDMMHSRLAFLVTFLNASPFLLLPVLHQGTIEQWGFCPNVPSCLDGAISFHMARRGGEGICHHVHHALSPAQRFTSAVKEKPEARSIFFPSLESSNSERYASIENSQPYLLLF